MNLNEIPMPFNDVMRSPEKQRTVYYHPVSADGEPSGADVPVSLNPDGSADISGLPLDIQGRLNAFGVPDMLRINSLFPKDGRKFMVALARNSNGYANFSYRSSGTPKQYA